MAAAHRGGRIRALDFDYVQPPLSDGQGKCHDLLLTVLVTPRIPHIALPAGRAAVKPDPSGDLPPAATSLPLSREEGSFDAGGKQARPRSPCAVLGGAC
jgi:hypothetical protein